MLAINDIKVPDIGDFKDVPVIEIHVQAGAKVSVDDPLVSLESDKATMDVPATQAGTVEEVLIKIGDRVSEGVPILRLRAEEAAGDAPVTPPPSVIAQQEPAPQPRQAAPPPPQPGSPTARSAAPTDFAGVHASPSVRRLARELEVDLAKLKGTGEKGRVTAEDVKAFLNKERR